MATKSEIQALLDQAQCFSCYSNGSVVDLLKLALLSQISAGGVGTTGVQGQYGNYAGGDPTWTPTSDVAIAFDTSTAPATLKLWYAGAWH